MMKDYAKLKQPAPAQKSKRLLPTLLLTITAITLLTGLVIQIRQHSHHLARVKKQVSVPKKVAKQPATEFEFYTLLSKSANHPKAEASPPPPTTSDEGATANYQLQTASLQSRLDAQRFARQLLSLGFKANIKPYLHPDGTTWYRVIIGPIDSFASAKSMQGQLQQHQIDSLLSRT